MNKIVYLALLTTLISGCGAEIAYKQGASARDLQANKAACQDAKTESALHQCLEDNGWAVQRLGEQWLSDDDLFATASETDNNHPITKTKKAETLKTTESILVEEPPKTAEVIKSASSKKATVTAPESDKAKPNVIKAETVVKPQPDLFETYEIKSWWKMGGNPKQLEQNMDECRASLGKAHEPDKKTFTFTRGFAICMREKGWRGLITQK